MPLKSCSQVVRDADIVTRWVEVAPDDVHDSFFDSMHTSDGRRHRASAISEHSFRSHRLRSKFLRRWSMIDVAKTTSDFARFASFVETGSMVPGPLEVVTVTRACLAEASSDSERSEGW
jgi:hypothetical protein